MDLDGGRMNIINIIIPSINQPANEYMNIWINVKNWIYFYLFYFNQTKTNYLLSKMSSDNNTTIEIIKAVFGTVILGALVYNATNNEIMKLTVENYRLRNDLYQAIRKIELYEGESNNKKNMGMI